MNKTIKKISVNDFKVVKPSKQLTNKEKIFETLKNISDRPSVYGLLRSAIDLAYTHGYCDAKQDKPMEKAL